MSDTIMYILALALIFLTGFNLYATMTSKKRKEKAKLGYHSIIWPIEERLLREMKDRNLEYNIVKRMLTDQDMGIIFCSDEKKRKAVIATADESIHFDFEDLKESEVLLTYQGKKILKAEVKATIKNMEYTFSMASKSFNPRSFMGKVMYETVEEFGAALEQIRKS